MLFWDESNWESLCVTHHSSDKQRQENGGTAKPRLGASMAKRMKHPKAN